MSDEPHYDYDLTDADIVEEDVPTDVITGAQAQQATADHDHEVAVATAKEAIRQRGILMKDLETALNMCRRYRGILRDNALPDPNAVGLDPLLKKYGMTGAAPTPPRGSYTPDEQARIAALTVGLRGVLPIETEVSSLSVAQPPRELTTGG